MYYITFPRDTSKTIPCTTTIAALAHPKSTSEIVSCTANSDTSGRPKSSDDDPKKDSTDKSGSLQSQDQEDKLTSTEPPKLELSPSKKFCFIQYSSCIAPQEPHQMSKSTRCHKRSLAADKCRQK